MQWKIRRDQHKASDANNGIQYSERSYWWSDLWIKYKRTLFGSVALLEHIERIRVSSQMWLRIVHLVKWFISAVVAVAALLLLLWLRFSSSNKSPVLLRNSAFNYEMMSCYVYVVHMCVYVGPVSFYIHSTYTVYTTNNAQYIIHNCECVGVVLHAMPPLPTNMRSMWASRVTQLVYILDETLIIWSGLEHSVLCGVWCVLCT